MTYLTTERRATVDAILRELPMSDDGTGHIADCGYTDETQTCGCYTLPERIAARIAEAKARALREAAAAMDAAAYKMPASWLSDRAALIERGERT